MKGNGEPRDGHCRSATRDDGKNKKKGSDVRYLSHASHDSHLPRHASVAADAALDAVSAAVLGNIKGLLA